MAIAKKVFYVIVASVWRELAANARWSGVRAVVLLQDFTSRLRPDGILQTVPEPNTECALTLSYTVLAPFLYANQ